MRTPHSGTMIELEKRLRHRAGRQDLVQRNILPPLALPTAPKLFTQSQQLQRAKNADSLQKKLRNRPDRCDLQQLNILPDLHLNIDPALQAKQVQLMRSKKADSLNEKLANRPGPIQLLKDRILEPKLADVMKDVDLERQLESSGGQEIPSIALQRTASESHKILQQRHSIATSAPTAAQISGSVSPTKDLTSPLTLEAHRRKMSDSSLSPANSPGDVYNEDSRSPPVASPRGFNSSYPPGNIVPPNPAITSGILAAGIGKAPSPSQARKKAQKQQKYRKLRYHEYVPPTKNAPKGGKQTPKTPPKSNNPYDLLLQQQQLFLQLQVLNQQNTNGTLMQKLPDLINSLSKEEKSVLAAVKAGHLPASSGSGEGGLSIPKQISISPQLPQVINVEMPNKQGVLSVRFDDLKVSDLKAACKEMGMIVSGKKAELVERLLEANKRLLPARALPETPAKDTRRQAFSLGANSMDSQLSGPPTSSPSSPSSPVFTYPADHHNGGLQHSQTYTAGMKPPHTNPPMRIESMPAMIPEVFPASTLQHEFTEMLQQQKRSYISQKGSMGAKSLAPCPDLNELIAIKLPSYPSQAPPTYQQSVNQKGSKGGGALPHRTSDPKLQSQPGADKSSHSLPSSPITHDDMFVELMDESAAVSSAGLTTPSSLATTMNGVVSRGPPVSLNDATFLVPTCAPVILNTTAARVENAHMGNNTVVSPGLSNMALAHAHHLQDELPLRPGRMSVPETMRVKVHPMNPPSYEASVQRSISLSGPPPLLPRMHNSASFNSDLSEMVGGDMNNHALMMDMDIPMETGDNQLSDLFDILKADGTGFSHSAQPQSLPPTLPHHHTLNSHPHMNYTSPTKLVPRNDSLQSDNVMLGAMNSNKSLTGSDLCLSLPNQEIPRNSVGNGSYNMGGNAVLGNGLSWLDLENPGTGSNFGFSPGFANIGSQSNPGSLPHDQFQTHFLDENSGQLGNNFMNVSNPSLNGMGNVGNEMGTFLDPSLSHQSGLLVQSDENTLVELGLSS